MGLFDLNTLTGQLSNIFEKKSQKFSDDREWNLTVDESGNGSAIIRFLPQKDITQPPIVQFYEHYIRFKDKTGKVKYYRAKSPQTIGKPCPVTDIYYELIAIGTEEAKEFAKKISRKTKFASNILVIKDNGNPENNKKVFYYIYGVKILDKIKMAIEPPEELRDAGIEPINVFDPIEGANFILIRTQKSKNDFPNYDSSKFDNPSALFKDIETAKKFIQEKCYDLNDIILNENTFQTYEELLVKFKKAIAGTELEEFLLKNGSEIITEPYDSPDNPNKKLFKKMVKAQDYTQNYKEESKTVEPETKVESKVKTTDDSDEFPFDIDEPNEPKSNKTETNVESVDDLDDIDALLADL